MRPEFQGISHLGASRVIVLIRGQNRAPRGTAAQFLTISLLPLGLPSCLQWVWTVLCGSRRGAIRCSRAGRGISCDRAPGPGQHRITQDQGRNNNPPKVTQSHGVERSWKRLAMTGRTEKVFQKSARLRWGFSRMRSGGVGTWRTGGQVGGQRHRTGDLGS